MTAATLVSKHIYYGSNEETHVATFDEGYTYTPSPALNVNDYTWSIMDFTAGAGATAAALKLVYSSGVFTLTAQKAAGQTPNTAYKLAIRIQKGR